MISDGTAEGVDASSTAPGWLRWPVSFVCLVYCMFVLVLLFAPDTGVPADGSNLVPFRSIRLQLTHGFTQQLVGNTMLLAPVGFTLRLWGIKALRAIAVLAVVAVGIELAQVVVDRISDVDDVILNVMGGGVGVALAAILEKALRRLPRKV